MESVGKKAWTKPVIEKINLEFDKEMNVGAACHGSNNEPTTGSCGVPNGACFYD